jgi:multidrug resistance efflux pump
MAKEIAPAMTGPSHQLFRQEALDHHLRAETGHGLVRVSPPWTWALLVVLLCGLGAAVLGSILGRTEVNGRGRGILRPGSGVRMVIARIDGTVSQIAVRSGQQVQSGDLLMRIEAPLIQSQLLEANRQLDTVRKHFRMTTALQDQAHAEQAARLQARIRKLQEQIRSQRQSTQVQDRILQRNQALADAGIVSPAALDEAREVSAEAYRQLNLYEQALDQASQEWAHLASGREDSLWQRRLVVENAETRAESVAFLVAQSILNAPEAGQVEAMLVKPGEAVQTGQALCKLIPQTLPLQVVVFLQEKDRAFVRRGDTVQLELDQLPYAEYGTLRGRVERISEDLASSFEVREALGDHPALAAPSFRIEVTITDAAAAQKAGIPLRSGMLLNARFTLRRQRLITLVLDPLRKWFR